MRTLVQGVSPAARLPLEYAAPWEQGAVSHPRPEPGREKEKMRELLLPLVKEAVQRQLKEQQEYYRSRPSLAARQMEQLFGTGAVEKALTPAVTLQVYEQLEGRLRREWIRKGR